MELWKNIDGFENYQISTNGKVKKGEKPIKTRIDFHGYLSVDLWRNGKKHTKTVHRLVAAAFLPNPHNRAEVNHINEDKSDSRLVNLEWCDHRYNVMYGTRNGRISTANSKLLVQIKDGNIVNVWKGAREAERNGYNHGSISMCCKGLASHHKGFQWQYID